MTIKTAMMKKIKILLVIKTKRMYNKDKEEA
jgi:hypothetical protein